MGKLRQIMGILRQITDWLRDYGLKYLSIFKCA